VKLNTDNPNTMPVTDAVYGPRPKGPGKPERERRERSLLDAVVAEAPATADRLVKLALPKKRRKR
jgi:hypothetical protein